MARLRSAARQSSVEDHSFHTEEEQETRPRTRAETARLRATASTSKKTATSSSENQNQIKAARIMILAGLTLQFLMAYAVFTDTIRLYPSKIRIEDLKDYTSRAEFTLRYLSLLITWLLFSIFLVMNARFKFGAFNPLDQSTEQHTISAKNVLSNSLEEIFISAFLQLVFASYAGPTLVLRVIPLVNILQFVGRIAFWWGYPDKRSFGFNLTLLPNLALCFYNLHRFAIFINVY